MSKTSIITVISGNDIPFLDTCLQSLLLTTACDQADIVAVCDSGDATREYLSQAAQLHPHLHPLFRDKKDGNAANRNVGASHADRSSEYLYFCDSDVVYSDANWLSRLVRILEERSDIGLIGSGNSAALGHFCRIEGDSGLLVHEVMDFTGVIPTQPVEMMVIPGYSMLIRRSLFHEIGGWDEGFFPVYGEDIDLCLRCILAGSKVFSRYDPGVTHLYRNSGRNNSCERLSDDRRLWLTVASCRRLALKYAGILPTESPQHYDAWLALTDGLRRTFRLSHARTGLPPTVMGNRLNPLYLPANNDGIREVYASLHFDY